jgi:hypothetical protein
VEATSAAIYGDDFTDYDPNPYFSDVPSNHWAFKYIQKMYEEGITSGCDGGNFCPTQTVTREQMAVFIIRAIYGDDFTDYNPNPYFSLPGADRNKGPDGGLSHKGIFSIY